MIQRIAMTFGVVGAAAVLALGLAAAGFAPPGTAVQDDQTLAGDGQQIGASSSEEAVSAATLEPKTVYVKPAPKPRTVIVRKPVARTTAKISNATTNSNATRTARSTRTRSLREHDRGERHERDEHEGHDD